MKEIRARGPSRDALCRCPPVPAYFHSICIRFAAPSWASPWHNLPPTPGGCEASLPPGKGGANKGQEVGVSQCQTGRKVSKETHRRRSKYLSHLHTSGSHWARCQPPRPHVEEGWENVHDRWGWGGVAPQGSGSRDAKSFNAQDGWHQKECFLCPKNQSAPY